MIKIIKELSKNLPLIEAINFFRIHVIYKLHLGKNRECIKSVKQRS